MKVGHDGQGIDFARTVTIPENEWFYMGLADATLGYNLNSHVESVRPGDFGNGAYTRGRLAFYLKGKIQGRYILTAAADTGESSIRDMFKGLDGKDPQAYLKRIDPDDYYPVYGDDSTAIEDAPTKGKFYVRLDKGPSHVMWGNFKSSITGTKFLHNERALYGAQGVYRSKSTAPDGGARTAVDAHAAMPGTVPGRDVFRGTGGSAYFVKHQDVTPGSETVTVEVRNTVTGWVTARKTLAYGTDYDFDYVQGVVILKQPLSSSDATGTENYLVATYEYTPVARDVDGYVAGGRAQQWLGDHVRLGATVERENTEAADQTLYGADAHVRYSEGTWLEGEVARSEGPGFGSTYSADGGLTLQDNASAGAANKRANAYRVEGRVALNDLSESLDGHVGAHYEVQQGGFSSLDVNTKDTRRLTGADADVKVSESVSFAATASDEHGATGEVTTEARAKADVKLSEGLTVEPYGSYVRKTGSTSSSAEQGRRGDAGVKVLYAWNDDNEAFLFGQGTYARTGTMKRDDRVGAGGTFRFTEKIVGEGEVSDGSTGLGAKAKLTYEATADDKYYVGYTLDPTRDESTSTPFALVGEDLGTIVTGARHRFNEQLSVFAEDNYDMFGARRTLAQVYGVNYTPAPAWTLTGTSEIGTVIDNTINQTTHLKNPDFDRIALSASVGYKSEDGIDGRIKGEWRKDDSEDDTKDLQSWLLQGNLGVKLNEDWRAQASFDGVFTSATDSTRGGDYAEGSIGFAYRPATGDRLNALAKYTYLYDLPGKDQASVDGTTSSPAQRSHIFSVDTAYDLTPQLTLGAKYGARIGETRERTAGSPWVASIVNLGILRADLHVVHEWDALLEGRVLWSPTTEQRDFGAIAALYRHFGDNMKVGVGYNFGKFSDDLRDLSQNDHGVFLNVIGTF
ncbi:MAG: TonB-dependent receptor [Hyphomicrobiales bacterium]